MTEKTQEEKAAVRRAEEDQEEAAAGHLARCVRMHHETLSGRKLADDPDYCRELSLRYQDVLMGIGEPPAPPEPA